MTSKTSVISLFVLVLATYCYSLPIEDQFLTPTRPTPSNEFSTGIMTVDHEVKVNMRLMSDEESTDLPFFHSEHASGEEHHMEKMPFETHDDVSRPTRLSKERFFTSSPVTFTPESASLGWRHDERSVEDFLFTTMESSTQFEERSVNGAGFQSEETSTNAARAFVGQDDESEVTTNAESFSSTWEPSTSSDSFVKFTGLLNNQTEETTQVSETQFEQSSPSTTPELEKDEESTPEMPLKPQRFVKTISVIPGKITETKIYANEPNQSVFMRQPNQKEYQLTQGSTLLLFLLAALLFCACLMASVIAIVKSSQSLKRRSRITEMEADLDKEYRYYEK